MSLAHFGEVLRINLSALPRGVAGGSVVEVPAPVKYARLVERLQQALREYGYAELEEGPLADVQFVARIMTPRRRTVRYVCAVIEAPAEARDLAGCRRLFKRIRRALAAKYARSPWWQELGTFVVLLCATELYENVHGHEAAFLDRTGLHVNAMLGNCLVDVERLESSAESTWDSTWGLFRSGKHHGAIRTAIVEWCAEQKAQRSSG